MNKLKNMDLKQFIKSAIRECLNEARYININNMDKEQPLLDNETLRVFHGFNNFADVESVLKNGLSGKVRAKRIYSYESGNNPYGLFVSVDLNIAKEFAEMSGVVIEFSTKVRDLEAPVWVGGRSYYIQGEYTEAFKDMDEREQQKLLNRQKSGESPYDYISKSDRPELASTIFDNRERQALYVGDLNPNMIKAVWYNEKLHKDKRLGGGWVRLSRKEFIDKLSIETNNTFAGRKKYYPNDDFTIEDFKMRVGRLFSGHLDTIISDINDDYTLSLYGFYPKQIKQIKDLYQSGAFDPYIS